MQAAVHCSGGGVRPALLLSTGSSRRSCILRHQHTRQPQLAAAAAAVMPLPPPPLRRRCRCAAAATEGPDLEALFCGAQQQAQPYVGPVRPVRLKGGGVSLEASKTLGPGELLLVSTPLALRRHSADEVAAVQEQGGDAGAPYPPSDADVDGLAEQLGANSSARAQGWLRCLDDGSLDEGRASQLPDLAALAAASSSSSSSSGEPLDDDTLLDISDVNVRVLQQDAALLALSGGPDNEPDTLVGVWPELALLQHSCCPNTAVISHQDAALVHAVRSIPKQASLNASLLGAQLLAPLPQRRALLQQHYGLACGCPRCRDEERQDKQLRSLVADVYEACVDQVAPELADAVGDEGEAGAAVLEGLRDQLAAYCEVVDAAFSKLAVKQQSQIWLQASLFRLYELTALATAALGESEPRLLELLAALAGEVAPGSPEHVLWAAQYKLEVAADEEAAFDGALRQADKLSYAAHKARYGGRLSRALYLRLEAALLDAGGGGDEWVGDEDE